MYASMIHNLFVFGFRYEDFFTSQKRPIQKKKPKYEEDDESDDTDMDEPESDDSNQVIYIISAAPPRSLGLLHICVTQWRNEISLLFICSCSCLRCSSPSFVSFDILTHCLIVFL